MARNFYLRPRGGRYDWRRRIPPSLIGRFGRVELIKSLGVVPYAEAREFFVWAPVESQAITLAFARKRMKLEAETEGVAPLISLLEQSHTFIAHENVFWISEPPRFISENTMHYGDGWTVTVSPELQDWSRRLSLSFIFGDAVLP